MRIQNQDINIDIQDIIADVQILLDNLTLSTHRGNFVETERVSIMTRPTRSTEEGHFTLPFTVLPLAKPKNWLKDVPILLNKMTADGETPMTMFCRLNESGEAIFYDLPAGTYQPSLLSPKPKPMPRREPAALPDLISFPVQRLQLRPTGKSYTPASQQERTQPITRYICQTNSLRIEVKELETRDTQLVFRSKDSCWDYGLLMFNWRDLPQDDEVEVKMPSETQQYITVMAWNDRLKEYRAEMNVGRVLHGFEINPPDKPLNPQQLTSDFEQTVRVSLDHAAMKNRVRQAWRQLVEREVLPVETSQMVSGIVQ